MRASPPRCLNSSAPGPWSPIRKSRLLDAHGVEIASNDNWSAAPDAGAAVAQAAARTGAFPLVNRSREAALLVTVPPGTYTALVSDVTGQSGIALVEASDTSDN